MIKRNICLISFMCLLGFTSIASAIQVRVISTSHAIMGLGFSVNGKQYGGMGSSYTKKDAPIGTYSFGLRAGRDVGCTLPNGKSMINLKRDATAILNYSNGRCLVRIS